MLVVHNIQCNKKMNVKLINSEGKEVCELEISEAPYKFSLDTIWGKKEYKLNFNFLKDKATNEKDFTKLKGAQLQ